MTAPEPVDLVGAWQLFRIGADDALGRPVLQLHEDGRISGNGGVNRLIGSFELVDGALRCGPLGTTRMAGPPELMAQENRLLAVLAEPLAMRRDGSQLVLGTGDDRLTLTRVASDGAGE